VFLGTSAVRAGEGLDPAVTKELESKGLGNDDSEDVVGRFVEYRTGIR